MTDFMPLEFPANVEKLAECRWAASSCTVRPEELPSPGCRLLHSGYFYLFPLQGGNSREEKKESFRWNDGQTIIEKFAGKK